MVRREQEKKGGGQVHTKEFIAKGRNAQRRRGKNGDITNPLVQIPCSVLRWEISAPKKLRRKKNVGVGVTNIRGQTPIFSLLFLSDFVHLVFLIVYVRKKGSYIYFRDEEICVMAICDKRQALPQSKKKNILEKEERLRQSFLAGPLLLVNARYSTYKRIDTTYYSRNGTQYIPCKIFI